MSARDDRSEVIAPLAGLRVVDCSLLEPGSLAMLLGELGADVVKVEPPGEGDYARRMAWPIVDGISLLHWHANRAKRSMALDLRTEAGVEVFLELVEQSDVVVEGMRPGALARRGLTRERLQAANPRIVGCTLSGFGATGPYRDIPSHGVAFDAWAGVAPPAADEEGHPYIPDHVSIGTKVAPVWAALGVVSAVLQAQRSGQGTWLDVAQTDVAAAVNWLAIEGHRAYERPEDEVTGNPTDGYARRAPGVGGLRESVRYQYYATADGYILLMASEREFWENFCRAVDRVDLYEARPGEKYADHAVGDTGLRRELASIFATRATGAWVELGVEANVPICPVNLSESIGEDPQFQDRFGWLPAAAHGTDMLPSPLHFEEASLPPPRRAPAAGEHTDEVARQVLGFDDRRMAVLREAGAFGPAA